METTTTYVDYIIYVIEDQCAILESYGCVDLARDVRAALKADEVRKVYKPFEISVQAVENVYGNRNIMVAPYTMDSIRMVVSTLCETRTVENIDKARKVFAKVEKGVGLNADPVLIKFMEQFRSLVK